MSECVPSYRRHKPPGQAVVTLPDGLGGLGRVLLRQLFFSAVRLSRSVATYHRGRRFVVTQAR